MKICKLIKYLPCWGYDGYSVFCDKTCSGGSRGIAEPARPPVRWGSVSSGSWAWFTEKPVWCCACVRQRCAHSSPYQLKSLSSRLLKMGVEEQFSVGPYAFFQLIWQNQDFLDRMQKLWIPQSPSTVQWEWGVTPMYWMGRGREFACCRLGTCRLVLFPWKCKIPTSWGRTTLTFKTLARQNK